MCKRSSTSTGYSFKMWVAIVASRKKSTLSQLIFRNALLCGVIIMCFLETVRLSLCSKHSHCFSDKEQIHCVVKSIIT